MRGDNALHAASARGQDEAAALLLEKGANVDAQGGSYGSALQAASYYGHKGVVKYSNQPVQMRDTYILVARHIHVQYANT